MEIRPDANRSSEEKSTRTAIALRQINGRLRYSAVAARPASTLLIYTKAVRRRAFAHVRQCDPCAGYEAFEN